MYVSETPLISVKFEYFADADAAEETHHQQREQQEQHHVSQAH